MLEKRIKSRFSNRHVLLPPFPDETAFADAVIDALTADTWPDAATKEYNAAVHVRDMSTWLQC